jgi:hypothetical protein
VVGGLIFFAFVIALGLFFLRKRRDTWGAGSSNFRQPHRTRSKVDLTYDPGLAPIMDPYTSGSITPIFSDSNPYLDEPPHQQYPARYQLPSQYSQSTPLSQHQPHSFSGPDTDSFNPYVHSEAAPSTIVQPFVNPPPPRDSISSAQRKAALAGTSAYIPPSRFIVHTDVDDIPPNEEIVELPPHYSDRRSPSPHHAMSSNSQFVQGSAAPFLKS